MLTLDVHSLFAGLMILCIDDSSCIVTWSSMGSIMLRTTPSSSINFHIQNPILPASRAIIYSASTVESVVLSRLKLFQHIAPPLSMYMYPMILCDPFSRAPHRLLVAMGCGRMTQRSLLSVHLFNVG
jgi:hypothetical protein